MLYRFLPTLATFLALSTTCDGEKRELSEAVAKQRACEYVRSRLGFPDGYFLRATRREDFEDDLFAAQVKVRGQIHKAALFFEVTETGYEVRSPDEVLLHNSVDGVGRWYVALDPLSGNVFGLSGFADPVIDFNKMATGAEVQLTSVDSARSWASFYLAVGVGSSNGTYLSRPVDLRRQVEDIAEAYANSRKHPLVPTRWLQDLEKSGVKPVFGVQIKPEGGGFHVQVDSIAISTGQTPVLQQLSFSVSSRGDISDQGVESLFPRASAAGQ